MNWTIPGTTLEGQRSNADGTEALFQSLFLAGGLTLSQVARITGLENHTIQNWVKRGFLPPPQNKRYNMEQLCRIININILKGNMPLEQIVRLMSYLNGDLADESDDLVDDTRLYFMFVSLASRARYIGGNQLGRCACTGHGGLCGAGARRPGEACQGFEGDAHRVDRQSAEGFC